MVKMTERQKEIQLYIVKEMETMKEINIQNEVRKSVDFLKGYMEKNPTLTSFILGVSGGQDSTLVGKLAQMAVDELNEFEGSLKYRFIAVRLPYGQQQDEQDAQDALDFINPSEKLSVDIKPAIEAGNQSLYDAGIVISDFVRGNAKARERMKVQYSIAAMNSGVVLGTDHSAEAVTGFYTKFGDGACDLVPIFRLNKRQGRELLKFLECPEHLYLKKPTADLEDDKPQLPDEVALGVTYEEIDDYLEGREVSSSSASRIEKLFNQTEHKRRGPINVFDTWWL